MLLPLLALALQLSANTQDATVALLRAKDQVLLDALAPGNRKTWDQALAREAVYVDENGVIMNRAEYLKQLDPLPAGISGNLRIESYSAHIDGDLATVIHTDDEDENYYGQILHARYLMTETWRNEGGEWKLYLIHCYAMLTDPPAVRLPARALEEYAGRYTAAGTNLVYVIRWDGQQLLGGREGKSMTPLEVEVRDVLFLPGQPRNRKIFERDTKGEITGFVDRREGRDLVWQRASSGPS
jgi:hypothetical protein